MSSSPASLDDWLSLIESRHPLGANGIELGLERVRQVSQQLQQQPWCPVITVAGTNGKGSTCAMLEKILGCAGYRVGLYTSPHLLHYNERIRIAERPISDAALCDAFARVEGARQASDTQLTYFEMGTLAAWECFAAEHVDVIILEVGLGGRLDATNIHDSDCAIITTIDIDHAEQLGHTRAAIAREKAGILRAAKVAICADPDPPATLLQHAAELGTHLKVLGKDFGYLSPEPLQWQFWIRQGEAIKRRSGLSYPALRGPSQLSNASAVLAALEALNQSLPVAMQDMRRGLLEVELPGRFQMLPGRPGIVLDVAHNPQAIQNLADNLGAHAQNYYRHTWAVFGMQRDKDIDQAIAIIKPRVDHWLPCSLPGARAATAQELMARLEAAGIEDAHPFDDAADAFALAQEQAGENDRILVFGSFLTVAAVLRHLDQHPRP